MLKIQHATKVFGGLRAVNDVSTQVNADEIIGLIGPNGAGKTTLFNLIAGAHLPTSGSITFEGSDITRAKPDARCKAGIGRTFQLVRIFPDLSAWQNVAVGLAYGRGVAPLFSPRALPHMREAALHLLRQAGLETQADTHAKHLTLVDRKRLELARALATQPKLLLLDEWLAGLNPSEVTRATQTIRDIRASGITIIMVEHIVSAIFNLADRVICMAAGEKIAEGAPAQIATDPKVISAYLGDEVA